MRFSRVEVQPSTGGFANTVANRSLRQRLKKKKMLVNVIPVYLGVCAVCLSVVREGSDGKTFLGLLYQNKY